MVARKLWRHQGNLVKTVNTLNPLSRGLKARGPLKLSQWLRKAVKKIENKKKAGE